MEHPVSQKLWRDVLPWIQSSRRLRRQWFYRVGVLHGYASDILVALASAGIAGPVLDALGRSTRTGDVPRPAQMDLGGVFRDPWANAGLVLLLLWILLKVVVVRENVVARTVAVKACLRQFQGVQVLISRALEGEDPMEHLNKLYRETICACVDRAIQDEIWPWSGQIAPGADEEALKEATRLVQKYGTNWKTAPAASVVPAGDIREVRP